MREHFNYTDRNTSEISFPLGGIGTGCIGLAGNGRLIDWEIFNRPNKGGTNGFSFFAVKAERDGKVLLAKVLHGDLSAPFQGSGNIPYAGYGHGVQRETMAGFPHFQHASFKGQFPVAEVAFTDGDDLQKTDAPIDAKLIAFSPFIPINDKDSSLPTAIFTYEITNRTNEPLDVTVAGCLANPAGKDAVNSYVNEAGFHAVRLGSQNISEAAAEYGNLTLSTDASDVSYQSYWYRGIWFDNITVFWKEFSEAGRFKDRSYDDARVDQEHVIHNHKDTATLAGHQTIPAGETRSFRFVLTWHYPNYVNYWNPGGAEQPIWKNHYATWFGDSLDTAHYVWERITRLTEETLLFRDTLFDSTLPEFVLDAVSANMSVIKSPTVLRLPDGTLYGFEGNHVNEGSCEGSCTHVWNYEQVTPFLFPQLARTMREAEYDFCFFESGRMAFRMMLPPGREKLDFHAAADGQMGSIVRLYREWKIAGDDDWLRKLWPRVKQSLEYAWSEENADRWDADRDGVMEGIQHHTLDMELVSPNSWLTGYYHAALLAASHMAEAMGDPDGKLYLELYEQGRAWVDQNLFNGEYFHQLIDLTDPAYKLDPELGQVKYQVAEGCHIDQVIGQWFAHTTGLGYIFDPDKVRRSLESIYKYNFVGPLRNYPNACRIYALNGEKGLVICTYPKNNSPLIPVPYADECMNGFEYQAACHMIHEGLVQEGLNVVAAIRERYDGERRNPWNEFECGSNYVRSMASYGLLLALSGFDYDMRASRIGFNPAPAINGNGHEAFRSFWSVGSGWGQIAMAQNEICFVVKYGEMKLAVFHSKKLIQAQIKKITVAGNSIAKHELAYKLNDLGELNFNEPILLKAGEQLEIIVNYG